MKFSLLINKKMPTIVGIFIFNSGENFMLSSAYKYENANYGSHFRIYMQRDIHA